MRRRAGSMLALIMLFNGLGMAVSSAGVGVVDLRVSGRLDTQQPLVGSDVVFVASVANGGPLSASGVALTGTLPPGFAFRSGDWASGVCTESSGTITCPIGAIAAGSTVEVRIAARASAPGHAEITLTVSGSMPDSETSNDTATIPIDVSPTADLSTTIVANTPKIVMGGAARFTMTVANAGPSPATDVTVGFAMVDGPTFTAAEASSGSCDVTRSWCKIPSLQPGQTVTIALLITPSHPGPFSVRTSATPGPETDTNTANNISEASATAMPDTTKPGWALHAPDASPGVRYGSSSVYDRARGVMLLFGGSVGGSDSNHRTSNQLWAWDGTNWSLIEPAGPRPEPRLFASMVYDFKRNTTLLFGGYNTSPLGDFWEWNGTSWTRITTNRMPPPRYDAAAAFDGFTMRLFGGMAHGKPLGDTWTWYPESKIWQKEGWSGTPPAREGASMIYDEETRDVILFGGCCDANDTMYADTWVAVSGGWSRLKPAVSPSAREDAAATFDGVTRMPILVGGLDNDGNDLADAWSWTGTTWVRTTIGGSSPRARDGATMTFAPNTGLAPGRLVMYGGSVQDGTHVAETWSALTAAVARPIAPRSYHAGGAYDGMKWAGSWAGYDGFLIRNAGTAPVTIGTPWITGANAKDFKISTYACAGRVLAYNQTCRIRVMFGPTGEGRRQMYVHVPTSASAALVTSVYGEGKVPRVWVPKTARTAFRVAWPFMSEGLGADVEWAERTKNSKGQWVTGTWRPWVKVSTASAAIFGQNGTRAVPGRTYAFRMRTHQRSSPYRVSAWSAIAQTTVTR